MKRILIFPFSLFLTLMSFFLLSGCWEINNTKKTTRFEGKVIDNSTNQPLKEGFVIFKGYRQLPVNRTLEIKDSVIIDYEGNFDFSLRVEEEEEISTVDLLLFVRPDPSSKFMLLVGASGVDCAPYNCLGFEAGKSYKFDIRVDWPEN